MKQRYAAFLIGIFSLCSITAQIPHKVVLCGICKDIAQRIPHSMRIMEKIGNLFEDYRVIMYENNSGDATPQLLKDWQNRNQKVLAITENISKADLDAMVINRHLNGDFFRIELIARARNVVLDTVLSDDYADFSYVIWMDMDFIIEPRYSAIQEIFETDREWDAIFAYGVDPYYRYWDWYALRDCRYPIGAELLGKFWWRLHKQLILDPHGDWYPVQSAFGGCGIYKKESIKGCRYSALVTQDLARCIEQTIQKNKNSSWLIQWYLQDLQNIQSLVAITNISTQLPNIKDEKVGIKIPNLSQCIIWRMNSDVYKYPGVCEHVPFHASMIARGHDKLFINPRLVFRYGEFVG